VSTRILTIIGGTKQKTHINAVKRHSSNESTGRRRRGAAGLRPRFVAASLSLSAVLAAHAEDGSLTNEVQLLREQNALLQQQLQKQNNALDALAKKVDVLESAVRESTGENNAPAPGGLNLGKVNLSAEGGVAFFNTGSDGFAPHSDFRVDEARLFVEAPIWNEVYFYGDIDLATRENMDNQIYLGELYLDFEDVSQLWGKDGQLNVRAGRMLIPFGEEYQDRFAMENPLISHSLTDFWGYDQGLEFYGRFGKFSYVAAVLDGGGNTVEDFDGSVAARISYDPNPHWHFSLSGMRTGDLDVQQDGYSALWFAGAWFRSIGSPATTKFHANLVEGDATARWNSGHISAFGGYARYDDNDPMANNGRNIFFYSVEAVQDLPGKFYTAARFSQIFVDKGYPIMGFGNFSDYYENDLTGWLWRLSLGLGYRFSDHLTVKVEYAFEHGKEPDGELRNDEDFFGTEAAFKF
jgi:hypothetical protein